MGYRDDVRRPIKVNDPLSIAWLVCSWWLPGGINPGLLGC